MAKAGQKVDTAMGSRLELLEQQVIMLIEGNRALATGQLELKQQLDFMVGKRDEFHPFNSEIDSTIKLFEEMSERTFGDDYERTVVVTVYDTLYPTTKEILHQVFGSVGMIEKIDILPSRCNFQALITYEHMIYSHRAKFYLQDQYIYDGCGLMDIQHKTKSFIEEVARDALLELVHKSFEDIKKVAAESVVEPEKSEVVEPDDIGLTPEEDSVVDSIQFDGEVSHGSGNPSSVSFQDSQIDASEENAFDASHYNPGSSTPSICLACPLSSAPMIVDLHTGNTTVLPVSLSDIVNGAAAPSRNKFSDGSVPFTPTAACFNKYGDLVYVGNSKGEILIIDHKSIQIRAVVPIPGGAVIKNILFSRSGQYLLTNSNDRTLRVYENLLPLKDVLKELDGSDNQGAEQDEVEKLKVVGSRCLAPFREFQDSITKVHWKAPCFSGDSEWAIGGSASKGEHKIYIWDRAGHLVKILEGPKEAIIDLAWHPGHPIAVSVSLTGLVLRKRDRETKAKKEEALQTEGGMRWLFFYAEYKGVDACAGKCREVLLPPPEPPPLLLISVEVGEEFGLIRMVFDPGGNTMASCFCYRAKKMKKRGLSMKWKRGKRPRIWMLLLIVMLEWLRVWMMRIRLLILILKYSIMLRVRKRSWQRSNTAVSQVLAHWSHLPEAEATWEDFTVIRDQFPELKLEDKLE